MEKKTNAAFKMSGINMSKVKSKLSTIKDKTEAEEDRKKSAEDLLREKEDELDKSEEEIESFKRRIQLVLEHIERGEKACEVSSTKLDETKLKFQREEEMRMELESTDRDNDDEITRLESQITEENTRLEESQNKLDEALQKLKVVETDLQKAIERGDKFEKRADHLETEATVKGETIRDLEDRDADAAEKEQDSEEKILFFQGLLDEANQRIEDAERKVPPIELYMFELINETNDHAKKKKEMEDELKSMADFADDSGDEEVLVESERPANPAKEAEPEPEPEPEKDEEADED